MNRQPVTRDDFDAFFSAVNGGHLPFTWQCELVDHVIEHGVWPDQISAPTGAGKSSVVEIHLFLNALSAAGQIPRVPRRLFTVVNRRGLVDNQYDRAVRIRDRMLVDAAQDPHSVVGLVGYWLGTLSVDPEGGPFRTSVLRGQLSSRDLPVDDPSACAVVAATPDMWGSRLLFRGYGTSRLARPREAAMVAMDSVLILDEAHLNRQLLETARRVADLQKLDPQIGVPTLQAVETTATVASEGGDFSSVGVDPDHLEEPRDHALSVRVNASKRLTLVPVDKWTGKPDNRATVDAAVTQVLHLAEALPDDPELSRTLGCIVNHVDTALSVAHRLQKNGLTTKVLVGRLRPWDLTQLKKKFGGLFTPDGDTNIDVVVATQTVEVGMDIDFAGLVTELAPGASLAQRFGRVNRLGLRDHADIAVLVPADTAAIRDDHPPYRGADLIAGHEWLQELLPLEHANPRMIHAHPPAPTSQDRLLFQRVERADLLGFARTSLRAFADDDIEFWLRDNLELDRPMGGIVVREGLPDNDLAAVELLNLLQPVDAEVFPARLGILAQIIDELVADERTREKKERNANKRSERVRRYRAFLYTTDGVTLVKPGHRTRPGDILIIDPGACFTTEKVAVLEARDTTTPPVVPLEDTHPGVNVVLQEATTDATSKEFLRSIAELNAEQATDLWHTLHPDADQVTVEKSGVLVEPETGKALVPAWYLLRSSLDGDTDEASRQVWTPSGRPVLLEDHHQDVGRRTRELADALKIADDAAQSAIHAATWHDLGKQDPRFQKMLGWNGGSLLAKSRSRSRQRARAAIHESGLPLGWRHEQLSALLVASAQAAGHMASDELALRIVGTSHGHGRPDFPHVAGELVSENDDNFATAEHLFNEGEWDSLIARTDRTFGVFTCAFLEYLERAADGQISKEGR